MHDVERVRPHVALRPSLVLARPRARRVLRLHEPRVGVEDREGRGERTVAEEGRICEVELSREDGDSEVVVYGEYT